MPDKEQKYCYLVEHPVNGTKVFYAAYDTDKAAKLAVDYAENTVIVFKMPLHDEPFKKTQDLSAQFSAIAKEPMRIELPSFPVEALLSSVG